MTRADALEKARRQLAAEEFRTPRLTANAERLAIEAMHAEIRAKRAAEKRHANQEAIAGLRGWIKALEAGETCVGVDG